MNRKYMKIANLKTLVRVAALFCGGLLFSSVAFAAPDSVEYKKETKYDFDDDNVEGDLVRPEGDMIGSAGKAKHSSLIKVRQHFIPEMLKSAEDI